MASGLQGLRYIGAMPTRQPASHPVQHRKPTILLTGFDAFGGADLNPSWLAVKALGGRQILGHKVVAARLPTVYGESLKSLYTLLRQHRPALVGCVGQAGGRSAISLERVAINVDDAPIADNAGAQPVDTPVVHGAPVAYFSTLPIKDMLVTLQSEGVAAEVSRTRHTAHGTGRRGEGLAACAALRCCGSGQARCSSGCAGGCNALKRPLYVSIARRKGGPAGATQAFSERCS